MKTIVRRNGFPVLVLGGTQVPADLLPGDTVETVEALPADVLTLQAAQEANRQAAAAQQAADDADTEAVRRDAAVRALITMTPAEIAAWVQANVNTLAEAKTLLGRIGQIVAVLARRELR